MRLLALLFCLNSLFTFSQTPPNLAGIKNQQKRLSVWSNYCDELLSSEYNNELRLAGKKGILMSAKTDYTNLSLFHFYTGITYDYSVEKDSAAYYLEKSEHFGRKAKNNKRVFEALKQLDYVYANFGESQKRKRVVLAFQAILDTTYSDEVRYTIFELLANNNIVNGDYEKGLSNFLNGIKIRRNVLATGNQTDSINFGVQLINVAELYIGLNKVDLGIDYLKESEAYIFDYRDAYAHVRKDFIDAYLYKNDLGSANVEYRKLTNFLKREKSISCWSMLVESDVIFAKYYNTKKNFSTAMKCVDHARKLAPLYADDFLMAQIDYTTGAIYLGLKNYKKALSYLKAAEPITNEDDPEVKSWLKKSLAETYAGLKNWEMAYLYSSEYVKLQDTLLTEKSKKNVAEMEALYQNEKKQLEINQLSTKNTLNALRIKNSNRQKIVLVVAIIAAFVFAGLIFNQSRNRKKRNSQLQILNEDLAEANAIKTKFFSIINHDLRSPVANLIHFLQIQQSAPELLDAKSKERLETKTLQGAENLLRAMEDMLLWSKGQMENFKPISRPILIHDLMKDVLSHFSTEERITWKFEIPTDLKLNTDPDYLQTIVRNLTANAITVLGEVENPIISWTITETRDEVKLTILDNGKGATREDFKALYDDKVVVGIKTGLGLHLIRDLANAIGCRVDVETNSISGTQIQLTFVKR